MKMALIYFLPSSNNIYLHYEFNSEKGDRKMLLFSFFAHPLCCCSFKICFLDFFFFFLKLPFGLTIFSGDFIITFL